MDRSDLFDCTRCCDAQRPLDCQQTRETPRRQQQRTVTKSALALFLVASALPATMAQTCISLHGSTACPAFTNASINTDLADDLYV
jgi:hypothetical protein